MKTKTEGATFTPGPWTVQHAADRSTIRYTDGELSSHVAMCFQVALCPEHGSREANARLIAAAPELVEALRELVNRADTTELSDGSSLDTLHASALLVRIEGRER